MSNTRYLEIDSTYRDRNAFPEISQFEVQISQSGRRSKENSLDPVCLSTPIYQWTSNRFDATGSATLNVTVVSIGPGINSGTDNINLIVTAASGVLQKIKNYYLSANVRISISPTPTYAYRTISYYEWLSTSAGQDYARIVLLSPFQDTVLPLNNGQIISILDPTSLVTTPPSIFVPNGYVGQNCYYGLYLYNETRSDYRRIVNYDFAVNVAFLDSAVTTWVLTDNYSIRKEAPLISSTVITASTINTISCAVGTLITTTNYYNHNFIRIIPTGVYGVGSVAPTGEMRRIVGYSVVAGVATFNVTPGFSVAPGVGTHRFEVLSFSYDNACPFVYSGSIVSQQEMVCYQIELLNLILPNKTLNTQYGSRIAYYPYVYVELSNVSAPGSGLTNIIYSNNPNSTRMIFRACIDDMNQPQNAPFIKIDGDKMVQTIKFKPNDNLRFRVILPNGELFRVNDAEYFSPNQPNDKNQITALFAIRRL